MTSERYILLLQLDWMPNMSRQKIDLPTNQEGYNNSETTTGKLSARRIQICQVCFSVIFFDLLIFKTSENTAPTKIDPADLICLVKYSSSEVSYPSEVPQIVVKLIF